MSIRDIVGTSGLTIFAEIALVLAIAIFLYVVATTFARRNHAAFERARRMPLDDVPASTAANAADRSPSETTR
jgi:cbb3-type cytochrome oxidase subunit 3